MNLFLLSGCFGSPAILVLKVLAGAFLSILFLQSGIDKVMSWKSELEWEKKHFERSPLKSFTGLLLAVITIMEICSGGLCMAGIVSIFTVMHDGLLFGGFLLSSVTIICLFFGQRMAKDYAGAQSLVSYFIVTLIGLYLFV